MLFFVFSGRAQEEGGEVVSLDTLKEHKLEKLVQRFTGTYQNQHGDLLTLEHLSFAPREFDLRTLGSMSTMVMGGNEFRLDLLLEEKVEVVRTGYMGRVVRHTTYELHPYGVTRVAVSTNRLTQRREVTRTHFELGEDWILKRSYSRKYYRRQFGYAGKWVPEKRTFNARHNTIEKSESYSKVHTDIVDLEEVSRVRRMTGVEYVFKVDPSGSAKDVHEAIEKGEYIVEVVEKPKPQPEKLYSVEDGVLRIEGRRKATGSQGLDAPAEVISLEHRKAPQCRHLFN